jgi:glycosyltransferase involved in cell wall biosynthesis
LPRRSSDLTDVLVVTVRKSFWASAEAERFPHRLYARVFYGHSTNLLNSIAVFVRALGAIFRRRPPIVLLGSVERTVPWFIRARRLGLLAHARLVVTNQLHLSDEQLRYVERNIVYSQTWIEAQRRLVRERAVFVPLPADGDISAAAAAACDGEYVFAGGGAGRDFPRLIEALQNTDIPLRIVTFSPTALGWNDELPANVEVEWTMPVQLFLERIAGARIVVIPLRDPESDFGQTTLVQGLALGKPVVATRAPGVVDYINDGAEGFLVDAGDTDGLRTALLRLAHNETLRSACAQNALARAQTLTYPFFRERIVDLLTSLDT